VPVIGEMGSYRNISLRPNLGALLRTEEVAMDTDFRGGVDESLRQLPKWMTIEIQLMTN